jgi:hypothetical protein
MLVESNKIMIKTLQCQYFKTAKPIIRKCQLLSIWDIVTSGQTFKIIIQITLAS